MCTLLRNGLIALMALLLAFSCEDEERPPLNLPANYDGSSFATNASKELALQGQLSALTSEAKKGRTAGNLVSEENLIALFETGNPSLQAIASGYYAGKISASGGFATQLALASGGTYTPGLPTGEGGVYGAYLFDENGIEPEQLIEKGLFGAAFYHRATTLAAGTLTEASADQMVALFGAHPDFPNTNNAQTATNPDKFLASYAARRDKNDGNGLYTQAKNGFIQLQAALKAGNEYKTEQDEALEIIFDAWEKANAATIINYCHAAISKFSATNPTTDDLASGLHAYSEGVGFLHGIRMSNQTFRRITDAEIDALLVLMNAPYDGTPTSYKFITDGINELPKLSQVIETLQATYGFSDQEVEDFKKNWVAEQGR
ncbi:MAG TPA: DUF4856 domain-containing protein [Saprospiraceae bacterium]|nr:DUF4856 domain-containing protein [Saprospiraceae bacterium]HMQ84391.1 DUF4856 domain-containing protein [Saprospiraceae bacterium]